MAADLPCPVLIQLGSPCARTSSRPRLGLLLEWKQIRDPRGNAEWRGLVVDAFPPVGVTGSWELRVPWMDAAYLTPVESPHSS